MSLQTVIDYHVPFDWGFTDSSANNRLQKSGCINVVTRLQMFSHITGMVA